ncbi:MAG: MJ0042-type zinc finger domain-containing protein, partial [Pusillimonas sp.]
MDLTTRCPECGTTFSASLTQLQLRKGYIRCINCSHIFDGYDAVVSPGGAAAAPAAQPPEPYSPPEPPVSEPSVPMPSVLRQRTLAAEPAHHISSSGERGAQQGPAFTISAEGRRGSPAAEREPVFHMDTDSLHAGTEPTVGLPRVGPESAPGAPRVGPIPIRSPRVEPG